MCVAYKSKKIYIVGFSDETLMLYDYVKSMTVENNGGFCGSNIGIGITDSFQKEQNGLDNVKDDISRTVAPSESTGG